MDTTGTIFVFTAKDCDRILVRAELEPLGITVHGSSSTVEELQSEMLALASYGIHPDIALIDGKAPHRLGDKLNMWGRSVELMVQRYFGSDVCIVALSNASRDSIGYGNRYFDCDQGIQDRLGPYVLGLLGKER